MRIQIAIDSYDATIDGAQLQSIAGVVARHLALRPVASREENAAYVSVAAADEGEDMHIAGTWQSVYQ